MKKDYKTFCNIYALTKKQFSLFFLFELNLRSKVTLVRILITFFIFHQRRKTYENKNK